MVVSSSPTTLMRRWMGSVNEDNLSRARTLMQQLEEKCVAMGMQEQLAIWKVSEQVVLNIHTLLNNDDPTKARKLLSQAPSDVREHLRELCDLKSGELESKRKGKSSKADAESPQVLSVLPDGVSGTSPMGKFLISIACNECETSRQFLDQFVASPDTMHRELAFAWQLQLDSVTGFFDALKRGEDADIDGALRKFSGCILDVMQRVRKHGGPYERPAAPFVGGSALGGEGADGSATNESVTGIPGEPTEDYLRVGCRHPMFKVIEAMEKSTPGTVLTSIAEAYERVRPGLESFVAKFNPKKQRHAFMKVLLDANGAYVSREILSERVWQVPFDDDIKKSMPDVVSGLNTALDAQKPLIGSIIRHPNFNEYKFFPRMSSIDKPLPGDEEKEQFAFTLNGMQRLMYEVFWLRRGQLTTKEDICEAIWGDAVVTDERSDSIRNGLVGLRRKLADAKGVAKIDVLTAEGIGFYATQPHAVYGAPAATEQAAPQQLTVPELVSVPLTEESPASIAPPIEPEDTPPPAAPSTPEEPAL